MLLIRKIDCYSQVILADCMLLSIPSSNPVTNEEFMRILRKVTGHIFGLSAYKWMLQIGAPLIGTELELVLKSRWVLPTRILETGFQFKHPLLEEGLSDIISKVPRKQYHLF